MFSFLLRLFFAKKGQIKITFLWKPCKERHTYIKMPFDWRKLAFNKVQALFLQCVIINKSDDKKTFRSRLEDSAVDYWAVHVGGTKNNNKHFY